jgi:TatD DNase family protein
VSNPTRPDGPADVGGWVDSHCHLSMLTADADEAVERARAAGVVAMVCVGTALDTSIAAVAAAGRYPDVRATVGLHPHEARQLDDAWDALVDLAHGETVVGIGETGFDLHYLHSPQADQERAFRHHIRLAHEIDRTLVIHSRAAWHDTFRVLAEEGVPTRTVFHCFTGGPEEARRALELGAWLSFSGIVSFKNADDVRAAARATPLDRMLVETDAPFLAPVPHRGRENEPALVPDVGVALAEAIGLSVEEVAAATRAGAAAAFGHRL